MLLSWDNKMKTEFRDVFEPIANMQDLPRDVLAEIRLKEANQTIKMCSYQCPRKYQEAWKTLIDKHLSAGQIRPSSSQFTSPAFLIPKADLTVLPWWVNDYWALNAITVPDNHPIPQVEDMLYDCAKGKYLQSWI